MDGSKLEEVSSREKMWELEGPCRGSGPCFVCKWGSECAASHSGCIFFWMLCSSLCEMLFWLKEEEMSHQELTQRLTTVITHVGKASLFFFLLHLCGFGGPVPPGGAAAFVWQYHTCVWNRSHQQTANPWLLAITQLFIDGLFFKHVFSEKQEQ